MSYNINLTNYLYDKNINSVYVGISTIYSENISSNGIMIYNWNFSLSNVVNSIWDEIFLNILVISNICIQPSPLCSFIFTPSVTTSYQSINHFLFMLKKTVKSPNI